MQIIKCRIILSYWEQGGPDSVSEKDIGSNEVFVYEYDAPLGWETQVGRGVLFDNDWCTDGTVSIIQVRSENTWVNLS